MKKIFLFSLLAILSNVTLAANSNSVSLMDIRARHLMGDKTQIATVALAAHYAAPLRVVIGTTAGMLIADVPAVFVANKFAEKIPMKLVHSIAASIFLVMGLLTLFKVEKLFS